MLLRCACNAHLLALHAQTQLIVFPASPTKPISIQQHTFAFLTALWDISPTQPQPPVTLATANA